MDMETIDPRLLQYNYFLPEELIAKRPPVQRDGGRLLSLTDSHVQDRAITDLLQILQPSDVLVINNTKVLKARLSARRQTGGKVEIFVLSIGDQVEAMLRPSRKLRQGEVLQVLDREGNCSEHIMAKLLKRDQDGHWHIQLFPDPQEVLDTCGHMPIPPYLRRGADEQDDERYQTVYAGPEGAVAAPTAGLHLTEELLQALSEKGVKIATITLHVGAGTFKPLRRSQLDAGRLHTEAYIVPQRTVELIRQARAQRGRIIAVGTTTTRCLEAVAQQHSQLQAGEGTTELFIRQGFPFQIVDGLLTNFHLPMSSLLMLVCAFGGENKVLAAYQHAVAQRYRFYSYGDAMFLWRHQPRRVG